MLARWQATITDEEGNVLPAATITVRREVSGAPLASLFSDRDGAVSIGNPFAADSDGFAAFHVAGGAYRITATSGGFSRTWRYVAIGLAAETDGVAAGVAFVFDEGVNDEDPGAADFRFNNSTPALATQMFISDTNVDGLDVTSWVASWDDAGSSSNRGYLVLQAGDASAIVVAQVTGSITDAVGYSKVPITVLSSAGTFSEGTRFNLVFTSNGANGIDGVAGGIPFTFSTTTAMADPGAGTLRLNNATLSSVTAAAVDDTSASAGNPDVSGWVLAWDDSTQATNRGVIIIKKVSAPQNFAIYRISGASTDNAGWTQLALTYVDHAGSFSNGDTLTVEFSPAANAESAGKQTFWIPASAMTPRVTSGADPSTYDGGSNDVTIPTLDFDQTTQEYAQFSIAFPKQWNEGTVTFEALWTATAGTAAQTVRWTLAGAIYRDDSSLNIAMGTAQNSDDALIVANDLHISAESSAITIGNTPSATPGLVVFQISRDVANDNLAADARLIGIKLYFTNDAGTDD